MTELSTAIISVPSFESFTLALYVTDQQTFVRSGTRNYPVPTSFAHTVGEIGVSIGASPSFAISVDRTINNIPTPLDTTNVGAIWTKASPRPTGAAASDETLLIPSTTSSPPGETLSSTEIPSPQSTNPVLIPASVSNITSGSDPNGISPPTSPLTTPTANSTISSENSTAPSAVNTSGISTGSGSGISSGEATGIAIGCLIAGALIGCAALWFFLRKTRRDRRSGPESGTVRDESYLTREKEPIKGAIATTSLDPQSPAAIIENTLPQPLEDNAISGEWSKISSSIKNHVKSYYNVGNSPTAIKSTTIDALDKELPLPSSKLASLVSSPKTRTPTLRLLIAWVIISRITLDSGPHATFLPPDVAGCVQFMTAMSNDERRRVAFLSKWRTITAALMQTTYGKSEAPLNDPREHNIAKALRALDNVLRPLCDPLGVDDSQRIRNLEAILRRAARFGFTLFSQPSSWKFEWEVGEVLGEYEMVVFPALLQTVNEAGRKLARPREFSEAEVDKM
ncbi:hypothetical protein M501DRAFT_978673 [Patellaria atrata CBS 101060]|uniref:Uncharacterized protein n=1 Tax=Patellaria atrata CBS 101060 TaxID=1346257 RepID=A0A9P4S7Z8_9PEZI|nr:hypothetical protein M501DRAFT_978673 [Patellaria atrata CBS 101060]